MMIKRVFDFLVSLLLLLILSPVLVLISIVIVLDSGFPVFYLQDRVGLNGSTFQIVKFRTMRTGSDKVGLITIGDRDSRVTRVGLFLRRYKLDEIPQLFNVIYGSMSLVGPRPEVSKYVALYNDEQKKVLEVLPGITDYASLAYSRESEILARSPDPENTYINEIMPAKLELNLKYIRERGLVTDLKILFSTLVRIVSAD
jgi:lipopolysaccharide/colanic/teichoic acid biosynthesis glycosyltransferase